LIGYFLLPKTPRAAFATQRAQTPDTGWIEKSAPLNVDILDGSVKALVGRNP